MSTYEFETGGQDRLVGQLRAHGGATGDVPTQQANGQLAQAPGGGSMPGASRWIGPCKINFATQQNIGSDFDWFTATGGTVTFTVNGETTAALPLDTDAAGLKAALEALPSISTVTVVFGTGTTLQDAGPIIFTFTEVEATDLLTTDASALTGPDEPYTGPTATSGDDGSTLGTQSITVPLYTPAVGDIVEDFLHAVVTAFDAADELTYTDDPTTPDGNGPVWANPSSAQGVGGIDVTSADDAFTNFWGDNGSDKRQQPSSLTALMAGWAADNTSLYGNLPNAVKNSVPIYTVIQNVAAATQGEVWIWVKTATPDPDMS